MSNNKERDYVIVKFYTKGEVRTYKHYKTPNGTLVNSGKKELISIEKRDK